LSLIFLGGINAVGFSTVLCVLVVGKIMNMLTPVMEKTTTAHFFLGQERFLNVLEFDLFAVFNKNNAKKSAD